MTALSAYIRFALHSKFRSTQSTVCVPMQSKQMFNLADVNTVHTPHKSSEWEYSLQVSLQIVGVPTLCISRLLLYRFCMFQDQQFAVLSTSLYKVQRHPEVACTYSHLVNWDNGRGTSHVHVAQRQHCLNCSCTNAGVNLQNEVKQQHVSCCPTISIHKS